MIASSEFVLRRPAPVRPPAEPTIVEDHFWPDHLGWWRPVGYPASWCRLVEVEGEIQILTSPDLRVPGAVSSAGVTSLDLRSDETGALPRTLARRLLSRMPLLRTRTPTVWEAAATAVVRQVVHRNQARAAFDRLSTSLGSPVMIGGHVRHTFPSAERVLEASPGALSDCRIGFKARTLRALAEWCAVGRVYNNADHLYEDIRSVPGIGPWTAAVTACDHFNDFSFYPVDDLAVRSHAAARWPRAWPRDPAAFAREWRAATAPHTAVITAALLADAALSPS